ncbi:hypothetical protein [Chroococcidiopsis sp.]|uniref:hypothetical protein n=1 Tax=Chroococcidiopsis sp. TaxID=3088168 RepID=UPI003F3BA639
MGIRGQRETREQRSRGAEEMSGAILVPLVPPATSHSLHPTPHTLHPFFTDN